MNWKSSLTYQVLLDFPETRGDDRRLIEEVWRKCGLHLTPEQRHIYYHHRTPGAESIRRTRQKIQEDGWLKPEASVQQARLKLEEKVRKQINE